MPTDFDNLVSRLGARSARTNSAGQFTTTSAPGSYSAAYGGIPAPTAVPPSQYQQTQSIYPNITGLTGSAGKVIQSQLAGELSPETIKAIQDQAAAWGVATGMPSSQLAGFKGLRNLGLNVEQQQQKGVESFQNFLANLARTTNDPALLSQIDTYNKQLAAAPDPAAAAAEAERLYNEQLRNAQVSGQVPSVGGLATTVPQGGTRTQLPAGAYDTPSAVYGAGGILPGGGMNTGGLTYNGATYYGGATPSSAAQNWQNWASSLPGQTTASSGAGTFYAGPQSGWAGINPEDYAFATGTPGPAYDFASMYGAAGMPYTDWANSGIDWSIYE